MGAQQINIIQKFQEEDLALFEAIKEFQQGNGDKATFIYENTKKYTYRMIHQHVSRFKNQSMLTGDENLITEDVMQELYLDFFKNISKFRNEDPKSFYKWISIVSNRMVLKYVDKNKMEVLRGGKDEDFREDNDIWDSTEINDDDLEGNREIIPEAALEDKEFQKLIMDFVQSLPEVQAQTVIYHFYSGMKYQEIADEMGVSLITVKTRMKKAQDSLKEIVSKYEKKTGTKLHSVSVLPMLWILYRLFAEEMVVPVVVDTAVTSSLVGSSSAVASGMGSTATAGVTTATKAVGTKTLIAIVSVAVVIGGAVVGSQFIGQEQEISKEQEQERDELEDKTQEDNEELESNVGSDLNGIEDTSISDIVEVPDNNTSEAEQLEEDESIIEESEVVITQEQIEARRRRNEAYREYLVAESNLYSFGLADVNGNGEYELLACTKAQMEEEVFTGPRLIKKFMDNMEVDGVPYNGVYGAGYSASGSLVNMEYCPDTQRFICTAYNEDGSYECRVYEFEGIFMSVEHIFGDNSFYFDVDANDNYWFQGQEATDEQATEIKEKLAEYFPYRIKAEAPHLNTNENYNIYLPIDDEGIRQQLVNEMNL